MAPTSSSSMDLKTATLKQKIRFPSAARLVSERRTRVVPELRAASALKAIPFRLPLDTNTTTPNSIRNTTTFPPNPPAKSMKEKEMGPCLPTVLARRVGPGPLRCRICAGSSILITTNSHHQGRPIQAAIGLAKSNPFSAVRHRTPCQG